MEETLRQVGELLLGSIPTVVLVCFLYVLYKLMVHKPLTAVLAERRGKTEGAIEQARADVGAAEARTAEYEQRLREAKVKVFRRQEERRQKAQEVRAAAVAEARSAAKAQFEQARTAIEKDAQVAKDGLQGQSQKLAEEIIRTILQPAGGRPSLGGEQR
jgi:F-type H+-transporting ATPase subunit b